MRRLLPAEGHLAENGEPLHVPFLDLGGTLRRLQMVLRPRPVTDEDGRLTFRVEAPGPDIAPPPHAFAVLRIEEGGAIYGCRPAAVRLAADPSSARSWLVTVDVRRPDGVVPHPGALLVGMWLFASGAPGDGLLETMPDVDG